MDPLLFALLHTNPENHGNCVADADDYYEKHAQFAEMLETWRKFFGGFTNLGQRVRKLAVHRRDALARPTEQIVD